MLYRKCNADNPAYAKFCRKCGINLYVETNSTHKNVGNNSSKVYKITTSSTIVYSKPFHILHPELHLRPISEYQKLSFWFNKPDHEEDPTESEDEKFLYIVKDGKIGILYWNYQKHWYGDKNEHERIIPCEYDRMIKHEGMFECHKGGDIVYINKSGTILLK